MKITHISLDTAAVKGEFETAGKSAVVYGRNGAGKSQVLRAIEFILNGGSMSAAKRINVSTEGGKVSAVFEDGDGVKYYAEGVLGKTPKLTIASSQGGTWSTVKGIYNDLFGAPVAANIVGLVMGADGSTASHRRIDTDFLRPVARVDVETLAKAIKEAEGLRRQAKKDYAEAEATFERFNSDFPDLAWTIKDALAGGGRFATLRAEMAEVKARLTEATRRAGMIDAYDEAFAAHKAELERVEEEERRDAAKRLAEIVADIASLQAERDQILQDGLTKSGMAEIETVKAREPKRPTYDGPSTDELQRDMDELEKWVSVAEVVKANMGKALIFTNPQVEAAEQAVTLAREELANALKGASLPDWATVEVDGDVPTLKILDEGTWKGLHELSHGRAIAYLLKIAAAAMPDDGARVLIAEDGSLLDREARAALIAAAEELDIQLFLEVVSDDDLKIEVE